MLTIPAPRRSDLNATTATRYDWAIATPSDSVMRRTWIIEAVVTFLVALACLTLIAGILSSARARRKTFNLYIMLVTFPDALFSAMCFLTCSTNAAKGSYTSSGMCKWQTWYSVFGYTANIWMNGIIAWRMHDMLRASFARKRYYPPTRYQVFRDAVLVYGYSAMLATLPILNVSWLPIKEDAIGGVACLPVEYDIASTLFFWLLFIPLMIGIPIGYICYVCYDVRKRELLPLSGRVRFLALYFLRIVIVFVGMWLPSIIFIFGVSMRNYHLSVWGGTWSHMQGLVSAAVCMSKPDVKEAVLNFIRCRCREENEKFLQSRRHRSSVVGFSVQWVGNFGRRSSSSNLDELQSGCRRSSLETSWKGETKAAASSDCASKEQEGGESRRVGTMLQVEEVKSDLAFDTEAPSNDVKEEKHRQKGSAKDGDRIFDGAVIQDHV